MSISSTDDSGSERRASEDAIVNGPEREVPFEEDSQFISTPTPRTDGDSDTDMVSGGIDELAQAVEQPSISEIEVAAAPQNMPSTDVNGNEGGVVDGQTRSNEMTMRESSAESGEIASGSPSAAASPTSGNDARDRHIYSLDGHFSPSGESSLPMEEVLDSGSDGYEPPEPISEHASPSKVSPQPATSSSASESDNGSTRSGIPQSQHRTTHEDTPSSGVADEDEDEEYDPEDSLPPVAPQHDSAEETHHTGNNGRSRSTTETRIEPGSRPASETGAGLQHQAQV